MSDLPATGTTAMSATSGQNLDQFRAAARQFLADHLPRKATTERAWGDGSDSVAVFHHLTPDDERALDLAIRDWQRTKFDASWGALTWPQQYGGRDLPATYERAFRAEEDHFESPHEHEAFTLTQHLVAPTLARFGTSSQKERFIRVFLRADELCCQLFSEPNAGSDLASLTCRATRDGANWVIDGQKVWTSGARLAEHGLLIARSDPSAPKHAGMTAFCFRSTPPALTSDRYGR